MSVNGTILEFRDDGTWWVDPAFRLIPVPAFALRAGVNTVEFEFGMRDETAIEAVYLLGDFGVFRGGDGPTVAKLAPALTVGDVVHQGLLFYSGKLTYLLPPAAHVDGVSNSEEREAYTLEIPSFGGACLVVNTDRRADRILPFPPYQMVLEADDLAHTIGLTVVLTRRNTFGPLHQVPKLSENYGPMNWRTRHNSFSREHQLIPAGLLSYPHLV